MSFSVIQCICFTKHLYGSTPVLDAKGTAVSKTQAFLPSWSLPCSLVVD